MLNASAVLTQTDEDHDQDVDTKVWVRYLQPKRSACDKRLDGARTNPAVRQ